MRVVGTLTTIPSRISKINDTIKSIVNQSFPLDAIYLNIPYISNKENCEYIIPDEYNNYCNIIRCTDYGPITKILGALLEEHEPDTIIITFDDDIIYPQGLVEKLITKSKLYPNTAIGSSGLKIGTFPFYISFSKNENQDNKYWYSFPLDNIGTDVDILCGYAGVLYLRKFFPKIDNLDKLLKFTENKSLYQNDDVLLSGYLSINNYDRKIFLLPSVSVSFKKNGLSDNKFNFVLSLIKSIYYADKNGMFKKRVQYDNQKTILFPVVVVFCITILISIFMLIYKKTC
jgi:hypothetical protein